MLTRLAAAIEHMQLESSHRRGSKAGNGAVIRSAGYRHKNGVSSRFLWCSQPKLLRRHISRYLLLHGLSSLAADLF